MLLDRHTLIDSNLAWMKLACNFAWAYLGNLRLHLQAVSSESGECVGFVTGSDGKTAVRDYSGTGTSTLQDSGSRSRFK